MNADIAIPRPISEAAERMARKLGVSIGELYTAALTSYVAKYSSSDVTAVLNQVYSSEDSLIDPELMKMQTASLDGETW